MGDDVYLEFDDEEEAVKTSSEPKSWKLLARYVANFEPYAKSMFTQFTEEDWRLRTGIRYSKRGKNYYGRHRLPGGLFCSLGLCATEPGSHRAIQPCSWSFSLVSFGSL
jgi:hypothetical protein